MDMQVGIAGRPRQPSHPPSPFAPITVNLMMLTYRLSITLWLLQTIACPCPCRIRYWSSLILGAKAQCSLWLPNSCMSSITTEQLRGRASMASCHRLDGCSSMRQTMLTEHSFTSGHGWHPVFEHDSVTVQQFSIPLANWQKSKSSTTRFLVLGILTRQLAVDPRK